MKNILKYLLLCCSALSLFGCEDYLDKTPQGDKTEEDVFTRFNETEQLINRLYFYVRAADQPLVHIRYFSDSALADECDTLAGRITELADENAHLTIEYESMYSLTEIESYARNVLGMVPRASG